MNFGSMFNNCNRHAPRPQDVESNSMEPRSRQSGYPAVACPVCSGESAQEVWSLERIADRYVGPCRNGGYVALRILGCPMCGHLYAPEATLHGTAPAFLSNRPVHPAMESYLDEVLQWVGLDILQGGTVLDVGAGTGGLSRRAARHARRVVAYEPNPGLSAAMLGLENIELRSQEFSAEGMEGTADLILCRQVLEHTADPAGFLAEMARALAPGGRLYLEVPDAGYVVETAGFYEFHPEHLQYFHAENLAALAGAAGLATLRARRIKGGHDMGLLLGQGQSPARPGAGFADGLPAQFRHRARRLGDFFSHCPGPLYLYGATWVTASLLAAVAEARPAAVLDDNPDLHGLCVAAPQGAYPVCPPCEVAGMEEATVLICSYIHAEAITRRLRDEHGFCGVVTDLVRAAADGGQ